MVSSIHILLKKIKYIPFTRPGGIETGLDHRIKEWKGCGIRNSVAELCDGFSEMSTEIRRMDICR